MSPSSRGTHDPVAEEKSRIRKEILARRNALTPEEIDSKSTSIQDSVINSKEFHSSKKVGLYHPTGSEVATRRILEASLRAHKVVALPKINAGKIVFCQVFSALERTLVTGRFGIKEPGPAPEVNDLDLIVMPGVAFGRNGYRLGYGKGFYDRYLAGKTGAYFSIGIGFDLQLIDSVPHNSLDKKLNAVVAEKETVYF